MSSTVTDPCSAGYWPNVVLLSSEQAHGRQVYMQNI
jgi:hypothetical protein